jgi:hypothetical protein
LIHLRGLALIGISVIVLTATLTNASSADAFVVKVTAKAEVKKKAPGLYYALATCTRNKKGNLLIRAQLYQKLSNGKAIPFEPRRESNPGGLKTLENANKPYRAKSDDVGFMRTLQVFAHAECLVYNTQTKHFVHVKGHASDVVPTT